MGGGGVSGWVWEVGGLVFASQLTAVELGEGNRVDYACC